MCPGPRDPWSQPSLFPERKRIGSIANGDEPSSTSKRDVPERPLPTKITTVCELTCSYSGVTLTKRFRLPLSAESWAERHVIAVAFVDALISDVQALDVSTCAEP